MTSLTLILPAKGTHDKTFAIELEREARLLGVPSVTRVNDLLYGQAIKVGLSTANTALVATMDTDGQHQPYLLSELVECLIEEQVDMVIATRNYRAWTPRDVASRLLNLTASALAGRRVPDFGSGFRVFRRCPAQAVMARLPDGFDFNAALTMSFLIRGLKVLWYPVPVYPRTLGQSHVRIMDGFKTFRTLLLSHHVYV